MYVRVDATIAVAVNVMTKVTRVAIVTASPVDNESESDPKQLHWPTKEIYVCVMYIILLMLINT